MFGSTDVAKVKHMATEGKQLLIKPACPFLLKQIEIIGIAWKQSCICNGFAASHVGNLT